MQSRHPIYAVRVMPSESWHPKHTIRVTHSQSFHPSHPIRAMLSESHHPSRTIRVTPSESRHPHLPDVSPPSPSPLSPASCCLRSGFASARAAARRAIRVTPSESRLPSPTIRVAPSESCHPSGPSHSSAGLAGGAAGEADGVLCGPRRRRQGVHRLRRPPGPGLPKRFSFPNQKIPAAPANPRRLPVKAHVPADSLSESVTVPRSRSPSAGSRPLPRSRPGTASTPPHHVPQASLSPHNRRSAAVTAVTAVTPWSCHGGRLVTPWSRWQAGHGAVTAKA